MAAYNPKMFYANSTFLNAFSAVTKQIEFERGASECVGSL